MKVVIQRSLEANVKVNGKIVGKIDKGYVVLVGFSSNDDELVLPKMAKKIINLRIFEDENNKMNYDIKKIDGQILLISQFTLYSILDGNRPSFKDALNYKDAKALYEKFIEELRKYDINVETGIFGEDMKVSLVNDGPVTILIDSLEV
jgi:D-aminoacyl-tRNA deacylase